MKLTSKLLTSAILLASAQLASAYDVVITGSSAARSTTHTALLSHTFDSAPSYIWSGGTTEPTFGSSDLSLFKGLIDSVPCTVMCVWSGSGTGIKDVAQQNNVSAIDPAYTITTSGVWVQNPGSLGVKPQFAMSDVFQSSTEFTSPTLDDVNAFVLGFTFVTNSGSPITNMTPRLMNKLYGTSGGIPLSFITGNSADTQKVFAVGRDDGSGTRITALAETGYGVSNAVNHVRLHKSGTTSKIDKFMKWPTDSTDFTSKEKLSTNNILGNGGYSSGGEIAKLFKLGNDASVFEVAKTDTTWATAGSNRGTCHFVSYLGIADAAGVPQVACNGVAQSVGGIQEGSYTFWSYEHFFSKAGLSTDESNFKSSFLAGIIPSLTTGSIDPATMHVTRPGGDGASVL